MKKLIIIIGVVMPILATGQQDITSTDYLNVSTQITLGDSSITEIFEGVIPDTSEVRRLISTARFTADSAVYADSTGYADTSGYALNAGTIDSLYHTDSHTWITDTIPKADSTRVSFTADSTNYTYSGTRRGYVHGTAAGINVESRGLQMKIDSDNDIYMEADADIDIDAGGDTYISNYNGNIELESIDMNFAADDSITFGVNSDAGRVSITDDTTFVRNNLKTGNLVTDTLTVNNSANLSEVGIDINQVVYDSTRFSPIDKVSHEEGSLHYCNTNKNLVFYNDQSDFSWDISREITVRFYNETGLTITEGTMLRSSGAKVNGAITFTGDLAGIASLDSLQGVAMATVDVLPGEYGEATILGKVNGLNTSAFNDNDVLYLSYAGTYTTTKPQAPDFAYVLGRVIYADADSGTIYILHGEAKYDPLPAFSAFFTRETETITNPGLNTFALITNATNDLFTEDVNYGFTLTGDSIQAKQDGLYNVGFSYSFQGDAVQGDDWRIGVFVNGVEEYSTLRTSSTTNKGGVPFSKALDLDTDDWVSVRIENTNSATRDAIFIDGIINITYITSE